MAFDNVTKFRQVSPQWAPIDCRTVSRRAVLGAGAAALAGCMKPVDSWTLRFRVKVSVAADGAIHEGAGVFKTVYTRNPEDMLNRPSEFRTQVWGEAIVIDIGERGLLFGLLGRIAGADGPYFDPGREYTFTSLLPRELRTPDNILSGRLYDVLRDFSDELVIPPGRWPTFVRFANLADRSTARVVIPDGQDYQLSANTPRETLAGLGARIGAVAVEVTDEEPTRRIERVLPWVDSIQGARGDAIDHHPAATLHDNLDYRNFRMEGYAR